MHPKAKLVLRIATGYKAVCCLSVKFAATHKTSRLLLEHAKELNTNVIGVSFRVGNDCMVFFVQAASDACCVFDTGAEFGFHMCLPDIGGSEDVKLKFEEITSAINPALDRYIPSDCGVRITGLAEPGRYYIASAFTVAVNIIDKKLC
uniref:ornithine decarboxylase-like n=1 Tax=Jaculus jaculus TaxID=51337 RepID=UPI001E1B3B22|nr:ornithine decarboxylase-like [Jaculus jaculus]